MHVKSNERPKKTHLCAPPTGIGNIYFFPSSGTWGARTRVGLDWVGSRLADAVETRSKI